MPRARTTAVVASPALAAETVIAALTNLNVPYGDPIDFDTSVDFTVGTSGATATLKLRRGTDTTGTTISTYGPFTVTATNRVNLSLNATDVFQTEQNNLGYVITLTVGSGAAVSTVNAVTFWALW